MSDIETLSAEDKAYFDTRGETVPTVTPEPAVEAPEIEAEEPEIADELNDTVDPAADDAADPEKPAKQVPLAALTKTRAELKAEKTRAAEAERKAAILEDRWNQILQQQEREKVAPPAEPQKPKYPEAKADPLEAIDYVVKRFASEDERREADAKQAQEAEAQQAQWNQTLSVARQQYQAAATADETFEPTYTALRANMGQEYMDLYGLSEVEARAEVDRYEAQQIAYAVSRGIDLATHMRKLAKARNVVVVKKDPPPTAVDDLNKLEQGVNGSTSLSNAGGGRVASTSAQSIADMDENEFAAWLAKPGSADKFRKLAGG